MLRVRVLPSLPEAFASLHRLPIWQSGKTLGSSDRRAKARFDHPKRMWHGTIPWGCSSILTLRLKASMTMEVRVGVGNYESVPAIRRNTLRREDGVSSKRNALPTSVRTSRPLRRERVGCGNPPEHKGMWNGSSMAARKDGHPYLSVAQLEARVLWGHQAVSSSLTTQTKKE